MEDFRLIVAHQGSEDETEIRAAGVCGTAYQEHSPRDAKLADRGLGVVVEPVNSSVN